MWVCFLLDFTATFLKSLLWGSGLLRVTPERMDWLYKNWCFFFCFMLFVAAWASRRSKSNWCIFEKEQPRRIAPYLHWGQWWWKFLMSLKWCCTVIKLQPHANITFKVKVRVATLLENLEKSGNWKVVREKSGKMNYYNYSVAAIIAAKVSHTYNNSLLRPT